jgi:CheY-like chemotaxis protein
MNGLPTILHADDSEDDRQLLLYAVRKAESPFHLQSVEDGQMAADYLEGAGDYGDRKRFPLPVLLLLDIKMPRMNGFDVLAWLNDQPALKALPVAILSSSYDEADVKRTYALGAKWYLMKPLDYDDVKRLIALIGAWINDPTANDLSKSPYFKARPA